MMEQAGLKGGRGLQSQDHLFRKKQDIFTGSVPAETGKTREAEQSPTKAPWKGGGEAPRVT